jgi:hypothetical protein
MKQWTIITFVFLFATAAVADTLTGPDFKLLFNASGQVTLGVHVYGKNSYTDLAPGYRADMMNYTDMVSYKGLIFDFLTGATTSIARLPETPVKLDKIRYVLAPGLRYPLRKIMAALILNHECIHTISRDEVQGSTWWNALQLSAGTKGAYHYYLVEKYNNRDFSLRNAFDAQVTCGYYFHGKAALIGHNHDYRNDLSGLLRYHFGLFRNQTFYADVKPSLWYSRGGDLSSKLSVEINYVILAYDNIATLYYNHCIRDDTPYDNESSLGAVGFKVIF